MLIMHERSLSTYCLLIAPLSVAPQPHSIKTVSSPSNQMNGYQVDKLFDLFLASTHPFRNSRDYCPRNQKFASLKVVLNFPSGLNVTASPVLYNMLAR